MRKIKERAPRYSQRCTRGPMRSLLPISLAPQERMEDLDRALKAALALN